MSNFTSFKGVSNIGDSLLIDQLTSNLQSFLDWSFLGIGAFFNVNRPASGVYGGNPARLRCVDDPYYSGGQVFETFRSNLVYESGIEYGYQPISFSGIYLNGSFLPSNTVGTYAYTVDFPRGRVTFGNTVVSPTSVVEMNYSYKYVNVSNSDNLWFKQFQFDSLRVDDSQFLAFGSGVWDTLSQNRIQLPAVVVEPLSSRVHRPRELGGGTFGYQDVDFHIFSETPFERNNIFDILMSQQNKKIILYDKNAIVNATGYQLNLDGSIAPNCQMYPYLVMNYPWTSAYFFEINGKEMMNIVPGLYRAIVRTRFELETPWV